MPSPPNGAPLFRGDTPNARFGNMFSHISGMGMMGPPPGSGASGGPDGGDSFGQTSGMGMGGPMNGYPNGSILGGILRALNRTANPTNPISGRPIDSSWTPPPADNSSQPLPTPPPAAPPPGPPIGGGIQPNAGGPATVPNTNSPTENSGSGSLYNMGQSDNSSWMSKILGKVGGQGIPIGGVIR